MDNHSYDMGGGFDVLWDLGLCDGYVVGCVCNQTGWDTSDAGNAGNAGNAGGKF